MAKRKRTIRVPAKDYQPTKAELEDPIRINRQGVPARQGGEAAATARRGARDKRRRVPRPAQG